MTPIYHITHVTNLAGIVRLGLLCDSKAGDIAAKQSIAHRNIKDVRSQRTVTLPPYGVLADYAPFYFAPRSPMLYTNFRGNVPENPEGQKRVVHLVSTVETVQAAGLQFVFTDGHAIMALSQFFNDPKHLDKIDWPLMRATYWHDTNEDMDRRRRRQAEFLVYTCLPWSAIEAVGVRTQTVADEVDKALSKAAHRPAVQIRPEWYY
jgi:hypothetical protein